MHNRRLCAAVLDTSVSRVRKNKQFHCHLNEAYDDNNQYFVGMLFLIRYSIDSMQNEICGISKFMCDKYRVWVQYPEI